MGFAHWNVPHISLTPARGGSHRKDVGRILFWKRTRPTPPEEKHQGVSTSPWTPNDTKAGGLGPRLWKPTPKGTKDERRG